MAGKLYDLSWLHKKALSIGYGKLVVEMSVRDGKVYAVDVVEAKERRTLEEANLEGLKMRQEIEWRELLT